MSSSRSAKPPVSFSQTEPSADVRQLLSSYMPFREAGSGGEAG